MRVLNRALQLGQRCWSRLLSQSAAIFLIVALIPAMHASALSEKNVVLQWNDAALQGVRDFKLPAPVVARALAIVHTCMYDAWTAYDAKAIGTQLGGVLRRPSAEQTIENKERAISYAAFRALGDVMPVDLETVYAPLMKKLNLDPSNQSLDIDTPAGIANVACGALLEYRHGDNANQLGDRGQGAYSDWTKYKPLNAPGTIPPTAKPLNKDHWQPLTYVDRDGNLVIQRFSQAHWSRVTAFALTSNDEFRPARQDGPALYGSQEFIAQADELIRISADLDDRKKMISEYWTDGPLSEQPPGHWLLFAQFVSIRDHHSLDDDVKMFFTITNALLDAGIAAWDAKLAYDSVRPITAITMLHRNDRIRAWGGPGKGTVEMEGSRWLPYQPASSPTPPFPEYVSGHSTYSAAAARILTEWTGSDRFGYAVVLQAGSSKIEPKITPKKDIVLHWSSFSDASIEAGMSRRLGGIHFARGDMAGRRIGELVAIQALAKARHLIAGDVIMRVNARAENLSEMQ